MADNVTLPATGEIVATDDIGGLQYQLVKVTLGDMDVNNGPVSATNPLPVDTNRLETLIALMSRAVRLMESSAIVDSAQRQRVVVDAGTITGVTTVTTVTGVTTVSTVGSVTNVAANAGMDREQYINIARQTYAMGVRPRLTFA